MVAPRRAHPRLRPARHRLLRGHPARPKTDLHSGLFGGAVANPAAAIARLVASLHAPDGRVAIDGFLRSGPPAGRLGAPHVVARPGRERRGFPARHRLARLVRRARLHLRRARLGAADRRGQRHRRRLSGRGLQDRAARRGFRQTLLPPGAGPGTRRTSWKR
jgi:hypothetical protein